MVLDAALINTLLYKARIKGKVEQSRDLSWALSVVVIEKGAFRSHSTKVANFTSFSLARSFTVLDMALNYISYWD